MRGRLLLMGLVTMAVATPLVAQADNVAVISKPDLWYSGGADAVRFKSPALIGTPEGARTRDDARARDEDEAMARDGATTRTRTRAVPAGVPAVRVAAVPAVRVAAVPIARGAQSSSVAVIRGSGTTHAAATPTAAPEMNSGFAATGLTLLLGGIAVLRSRSRSNA